MPAGDDEHHGRQRQLAVLQHQRFDVAGEVVHGDQRQAGGRRRGLRERHADQQRADEARPLGDRDSAELGPGRARVVERAIDDAADVAEMLSRGQFRHHAAPVAVNGRLRGDDTERTAQGRARSPVSRQRTPQSRRTRFDPRIRMGSGVSDSRRTPRERLGYGARKIPRSVMMPAIRAFGDTSKAEFSGRRPQA